MSETELALLFLKIAAYTVAFSSGLLLLLPTPEKTKKILVLPETPLWYVRLYNVLRFFSANRGWMERKNDKGTKG